MSPRNSGKLRSAAHRGQAEGAIGWIILSVLAVLIILPLGAVLLQIVSPGFFGNTEKAEKKGYHFSNLKEWIYQLLDYYIELVNKGN